MRSDSWRWSDSYSVNDDFSFKDNTIATVIKTNGVTFEITNTATPDFIKNLIEAFNHA